MTISQNIVGLADLRDYLKVLGWTQVSGLRESGILVMNSPPNFERQIVLPLDSGAPDYPDAVQIAFDKILQVHGMERRKVLRQIPKLNSDAFSVRFHGDRSSLPFSQAVDAISNISRALKSAACTALKPRATHPKLTLSEANKLIREANFDQTEEGSFVMNVSCNIFAVDTQASLTLPDQPISFVRAVFENIYDSTNEIIDAIEDDSLETLVLETREAKAPKLSSNFCEAISGLQDVDAATDISMRFNWAPKRPMSENKRSRELIVRKDYFPRIQELAKEIKNREAPAPKAYLGTVERLDGDFGSDGRRSGSVILALLDKDETEGQTVRVSVTLDPDEYEEADKAHMDPNYFIQLSGVIQPGRQPRRMSQVSGFRAFSLTTS